MVAHSGGLHVHGGTINTDGGDLVGGDKYVGLDEAKLVAMLVAQGHLAGLPLMVARRVAEGFGAQARLLDADSIERVLHEKAEEYRLLKSLWISFSRLMKWLRL